MNGCLIPDTPIMVDLWRRGGNPSSKIYFLSHMHSDHTKGLSASWRWPIHCSSLSAKLLVEKFQIKESLIRPLELDQSHIIKLDHSGRESMTVTLFDANHCPGSVMFLFEGYFGRILYTGDFRYDSATFPESCLGPGRPLDKLYMDNTFSNPRCRFPSRAECKQKILEILARHPDHEVVLGVYTLGKEDLLVDIALALKTRVVVSPARLRMLQVLEVVDVFTTDKDRGLVRLVPQRAINKKNMAKWNEEAPTVAVIPTGLFSTLDGQPFINQENVFIVPYSDHSSYPELRQFVSRVRPRVIIPIVKDSNFMNHDRSVSDMHNYDDLLDRSPSSPFTIPPSVVQFMSACLSGSLPLSESHKNLKLLAEMRKNQRVVRSNHTATGVVFGDEDEEGTTVVRTQEQSTTVDSKEQPLQESEQSQPKEQQARCPQLSTTVNSLIKETKASPREVTSELKHLQTEPLLIKSSLENRRTEASESAAVRKNDLLRKTCKRKSDESEAGGDKECLSNDDSVLIRSMSSKKQRVLPESCLTNPKLVVGVPSCGKNGRLSCTNPSLRRIQDFFKASSVASPENESGSGPKQHERSVGSTSLASPQAVTFPVDTKPSDRIVTRTSAPLPDEEVVKIVNSLISYPLQRTNVNDDKNRFSSRHICVKPVRKNSGSQNRNNLNEAFQNVFLNEKVK